MYLVGLSPAWLLPEVGSEIAASLVLGIVGVIMRLLLISVLVSLPQITSFV